MPQAWHIFRARDVSGISLAMYTVFTLGIALWLVYGVLIKAWPVVIANVVTLMLSVGILRMKVLLTPRPR